MANNKLLGKDGKYYDDYVSLRRADQQVELQEKQLSELQKQNSLMQQELFAQKQAERERVIQQENQRKHEMELAQQQFNHDQEMRILGLFDSIGLNKSYYDKFIKYLTKDADAYIKQEKEIVEKYSSIQEKFDFLTTLFPNPSKNIRRISNAFPYSYEKVLINVMFEDCYVTNNKLKEKYNDVINDFSNIYNIDDDEVINSDNSSITFAKSYLRMFYFLIVVSVIFTFICFSGMMTSDSGALVLLFLLGAGASILFSYICYHTRCDAINEIKETLSQEDKFLIFDEKKANKKAEKLNKDYQKKLNDYGSKINNIKEEIKLAILPKWNDFVDFRRKHYISQFENLLIDLKLPEMIQSFDIEYPKINNKNKIKDGIIEDYISYFDDLD